MRGDRAFRRSVAANLKVAQRIDSLANQFVTSQVVDGCGPTRSIIFRVLNDAIEKGAIRRLAKRGKFEKTGKCPVSALYGGAQELNGNGQGGNGARPTPQRSGPSVRVVPYRDDGTVLIIVGNRTYMGTEVALVSKRGEGHAG